jgi:uncharacterized membrane protein
MDEQTKLLSEIRDFLQVIAEPALAKRDERLRQALKEIVGKSPQRAKAIQLMDGSKTQAAIRDEIGWDKGNVSRFVKALREVGLVKGDDKIGLTISVPANFFDNSK